jgi:hypothetical protein
MRARVWLRDEERFQVSPNDLKWLAGHHHIATGQGCLLLGGEVLNSLLRINEI